MCLDTWRKKSLLVKTDEPKRELNKQPIFCIQAEHRTLGKYHVHLRVRAFSAYVFREL